VRDNVFFVLVRPVYLGNIGSTARVLKNFGFLNLRLVDPPRTYKDAEARKMAVGAFDILKQAEIFESLDDALKDISFALGTTSGHQRDIEPVCLDDVSLEVAGKATSNKIAFVFGDERNGLLREELQRCHRMMTVPTDPDFPALNMAQCVAVCAYELNRAMRTKPTSNAVTYPQGHQDDELLDHLASLLNTVEFSRSFNREKVLSEFRSLYQRAQPTDREASLLKGVLIKLNQKLQGS